MCQVVIINLFCPLRRKILHRSKQSIWSNDLPDFVEDASETCKMCSLPLVAANARKAHQAPRMRRGFVWLELVTSGDVTC